MPSSYGLTFAVISPRCESNVPLADILYGPDAFQDSAVLINGGKQGNSHIYKNQKGRFMGKEMHVELYVHHHPGTPFIIRIRGEGEKQPVMVSRARLYVCIQKTTRVVMALKYKQGCSILSHALINRVS